MIRFLVHWLGTALALFVCSRILPGVHVDSTTTLLVAALVLGFVNAIVKPIMVLLTLPITILTLGLFYFVINGLAFALAAWVVPGFDVDSIGWAILGSLVVSLFSWFMGSFGQRQLPPPIR
jgi:putative membrane protein